jgi:hypothetical protein
MKLEFGFVFSMMQQLSSLGEKHTFSQLKGLVPPLGGFIQIFSLKSFE